jgi:hypothetical protein
MKKRPKKIISKRVILLAVFILLLLSISLYFLKNRETISSECNENSHCFIVETECCPCNQGGKHECVSKEEAEMYERKLEKCPEDIFCPQVDNCDIKECECAGNKCLATYFEFIKNE